MKTTNLKYIAYALASLLLLQSCKVYHKAPVSVDEAVNSQKGVRVKTHTGVTYKFDKIQLEDDQLYGIIAKKNETKMNYYMKQFGQGDLIGNSLKFSIPINAISEFQLHNKTLSDTLTLGVPVFIVLGLVIGLVIALSQPLNLS